MTHKLEPTSDAHLRAHATSQFGAMNLEIAPSPPPEVELQLPDRYGMRLFELLVVDPEYVFVSWEIPAEQLDQTLEALGEPAFSERKLVVRLRAAGQEQPVLLETQLYGETGRWFLRAYFPGRRILAELGFITGGTFHVLNRAGPVHLPRLEPVEPLGIDELEVTYQRGPSGELLLAGIHRSHDVSWPGLSALTAESFQATYPRPASAGPAEAGSLSSAALLQAFGISSPGLPTSGGWPGQLPTPGQLSTQPDQGEEQDD